MKILPNQSFLLKLWVFKVGGGSYWPPSCIVGLKMLVLKYLKMLVLWWWKNACFIMLENCFCFSNHDFLVKLAAPLLFMRHKPYHLRSVSLLMWLGWRKWKIFTITQSIVHHLHPFQLWCSTWNTIPMHNNNGILKRALSITNEHCHWFVNK